MAEQPNYVLGRGELHFGQFIAGTQTPEGERYFGNTPAFALNISADNLDHYSSDRGIKEKDDSVVLQTNRSGSMSTDNINPKNVALAYFGSADALSITGATVTDEAMPDVIPGYSYQLGVSPSRPDGVRALDNHSTGPTVHVIVKKASATLVEGVDYSVDMDMARVTIIETGAVLKGDDLTVSYKYKTQTRTLIISGSSAVEGSLRFISKNPKGKQLDYFLPWVKITPNGDQALKGDDWQTLSFNVEVLKKAGYEAIYASDRGVTA